MTPGPTPATLPLSRSMQGSGLCSETPQLPYLMMPRNSMSITNTKGLLNMPGQNNCFLNSAVQVLWHLDIFRRSFRELSGHACMAESCIFCALKELFAQFQYSQESALPPDALRRALAETFCDQRRFQLGFMDDAAECFENILMRIHFHIANQESEDMCSVSHCIPHQKFAMTLVEQTVCHSCGATSEPLPFTQMVHYVPSSALCSQAKSMKGKSNEIPGFGELLRRAGGLGDLRDCPSSCGAVIQIRKTLMNRPEIVSVGLVWDSERPTIEHIMDVFSTIGLTLKLQDVFHSVVDSRWAASATHQLVGIVTYYGKHYSTFFFHTKLRVWIYFDDAAVREIGPNWEQVVEKCCRGHFQPLLLLYANPYGMSVCTSTAPRSVTTVHSHKKSSSGKSLFGISLPAEKQGRNHLPANCQRRALTPNPEVSYDFTANVQPRRAVTPSAEISMIEDVNDNRSSNQNCEASCDSGTAQLVPPTISNVNSTVQSQMQSWDSPISHNSHEQRSSKHNELKNCKSVASVPENSNISFPVSRTLSLNPDACRSSRSTESNQSDQRFFTPNKKSLTSRPASVDDLLSTSALSGLVGSEYSNYLTNGMSEDNICSFDGKNISCQDGHDIENSYINRKTVENVLHLQKLQRQKSMNVKHGHAGVSQRNSSSSLESLDNVFLLKDKGVSNFLGLKLDLPDIHNVARRRDSGNWSGDRNSASSSSTTSLDNPYCYLVGNRSRQYCNSNNMRNLGRTCAPEPASFTDPGYDSFSLSSSDSYPSTITNSPVKLDPRLVQIPENMQTAFLQSDFSRLQFLSKDPVNGSISCGLKDDCEKLCIEADIFLAKSVERENVGDISMAALLSDTAAAKARAAMDAPYSNTQSVALAKLKHSMCVIRSSSLHKKLKEAEAVQRRKQKESALITQHSHQTQHSGMPISEFNKKENSEKTMTSITCEQNKNQSNDVTEIDEYENTGKSIEIYATLPKKTLKKKGALLSFVESLTGEENSTEKGSKQKPSNISNETVPENGISIHSESSGSSVNQSPGHKIKRNDSTPSKSPSIKKKPRSQQKIYNRDSDLSDYSSEWEHTKKSSLYRTYSGPPSDTKLEFGELSKENLHQTFSGHPTKKQHKIRRKLMGGFMKRKNRSLPDLREGQDQASAVSRSFDDCVIAQTPISLRKQEVRDMKNSSLSFRDSQLATVSPTTSGKFQVKTTAPCAKSNEIKRPITYTQSFAPLPKTSPMKHVARTQTPPPYRPPPPIVDTNLRSLSPKRNVSQNEETKKSITHQTHLLSAKDVTGCTSVDKQKKQLSFIGRKIVPQPSIAENNFSLNNSCESNIQYIKYSYDNEIPKGSAVWLKELQLKQEELIQKRKLQEDKEKFQKDNSYMLQHKLACVVPRNIEANNSSNHGFQQTQGTGDCKQCNIKSEEEPDSHRIGEQNNSQSTTCEGPESPKSVKDLASKFEKILKPCLQLAEGLPGTSDNLLQNVVEKSVSPSNSSSQLEVTLSCSVPSVETKVTEMCGAKENNENASTDSSKQQYPVSSTTGFIYNPHLTEGQLTNMLRIGTNRAAFRNPNIMIANKDNYSAFTPYTTSHGFDFHSRSELRRPDKPPDYETALQRLELIRNDKKILCYFGNNGFVNAEGSISLFEQTKKKRGPKKSVTFSDKVVLVACAGDEDNDFIPNPLLERVYKQHLMQKSSAIHPSDAKNSEGQNMPLTLPKECSKPLTQSNCTDGSAKGFNASASQTSCHLCHKKTVTPPTVYCPDCAFYMSRFQQK